MGSGESGHIKCSLFNYLPGGSAFENLEKVRPSHPGPLSVVHPGARSTA
ncbi:hypothetical protein PflQ8_3187 [Pseudomonas fluorescens Q8r1-96]|nr:hypothetical protein PflQ8_3187 [Pseudomonas fluorescens Q8r1-96]